MTIVIQGQSLVSLPDSVDALFQLFQILKIDAAKLVSKPVRHVECPDNVLYVTQKEYAVIKLADEKISVIGSDDATTCHIVVLENHEDSAVCVAHLDSAGNLDSLTQMLVDTIGDCDIKSVNLDLSIIGGYCDDQLISENLTLDLLQFYHQLPVNINLKTACVGPANTRVSEGINWPIIYGVAVLPSEDRSHFSVSPAVFPLDVRGPVLALRSARLFCDKDALYRHVYWLLLITKFFIIVTFSSYHVCRVYHSQEGIFCIDPFDYRFPPRIAEWSQQSDDCVLNNFSTSPAVEPAHFAREIKQVFKFVAQNPFPMYSIFKSKKPVQFQLSPQGVWQII